MVSLAKILLSRPSNWGYPARLARYVGKVKTLPHFRLGVTVPPMAADDLRCLFRHSFRLCNGNRSYDLLVGNFLDIEFVSLDQGISGNLNYLVRNGSLLFRRPRGADLQRGQGADAD